MRQLQQRCYKRFLQVREREVVRDVGNRRAKLLGEVDRLLALELVPPVLAVEDPLILPATSATPCLLSRRQTYPRRQRKEVFAVEPARPLGETGIEFVHWSG